MYFFLRTILNLFKIGWELAPVRHDNLSARILQDLSHLRRLFGLVATDVADDGDIGADGAHGAAAAVLDSDTLRGLDAELFHGVQVDGGVGLAGRLGERGCGAIDVVRVEVFVLADLFDAGFDAAEGAAGYDCHLVGLFAKELGELDVYSSARLELFLELGDDLVFFAEHVGLELVRRHLDAVLLLQGDHHAAEVLADEFGHQLWPSVFLWDVV